MKNTIIKVLSVVMAMVMVMSIGLVATATDECAHENYTQYGDPVAETCTEWGYTLYECSDCGEFFTKQADLKAPHELDPNHEWLNVENVDPTCIADGYSTKTCSICETEIVVTNEGSKGEDHHDWDEGVETNAPTCEDAGLITYTCQICGETKTEAENELGHNWVAQEADVVEPKCPNMGEDAYGVMTYVCACGATKDVEILPREGCVFVEMEAIEPICGSVGRTEGRYCRFCYTPDPTDEDAEHIAAQDHQWIEVEDGEKKAPTCDEDGFYTGYCTVCKVTEKVTIEKEGHDFENNGQTSTTHVDATCTTWGYDLYGCTKCGKIIVNNSYAPKNHEALQQPGEGTVGDATCTEPAGEKLVCLQTWIDPVTGLEVQCDYFVIITAEGSEPAGHDEVADAGKAATCTEGGYTAGVYCAKGADCSLCPEDYEDGDIVWISGHEEIEALGHDMKTIVCTEVATGNNAYSWCVRCEGEVSETRLTFTEDAAEAHAWVLTTYVEETCTTDGSKLYTCYYCSKMTVEYIDAYGHNFLPNEEENSTPTCSTVGHYSEKCEHCGEIANAKVLPTEADKHPKATSVLVNETAPTCLEDGAREFFCPLCGGEYTEVIPALGHDEVAHAGQAATCTDAGWDAYVTCARGAECDLWDEEAEEAYIVARVDHDALGHVEVSVPKQEPTCTLPGLAAYTKCDRCGVTIGREPRTIPATGHAYVDTTRTASCFGEGNIGYVNHYCTTCGDEYIDEYQDKPVHAWTEWETIDPTCTEQGYDVRECENCGTIEYDNYTEATGHINAAGEIISTSCTRPADIDNICVNENCPCVDGVVEFVHEKEFQAHVDATCIIYAHDIFVCTVCGEDFIENVVPTFGGHAWEIVKEKNATFEEAVYVTKTCTVCDADESYWETKGIEFSMETVNTSNPGEVIVNGNKGIEITLYIKGDKVEFNNFFMTFTYPADKLVYTGVKADNRFGKIGTEFDLNKVNDGTLNITYFASNDAEGNAANVALTGEAEAFMTLTFTVKSSVFSDKDNAADKNAKTASVNLTNILVIDAEEQSLNSTKTISVQTPDAIEIYKLGDLNGDGYINNVDALIIRKMINGEKDVAYCAQADINRDGTVNPADFAEVQKCTIGAKSYSSITA